MARREVRQFSGTLLHERAVYGVYAEIAIETVEKGVPIPPGRGAD